MNMSFWRKHLAGCRSSLTLHKVGYTHMQQEGYPGHTLAAFYPPPPTHTHTHSEKATPPVPDSVPPPGRFHHPDVLQLLHSLNQERAGHLATGAQGEEHSGPPPPSSSWFQHSTIRYTAYMSHLRADAACLASHVFSELCIIEGSINKALIGQMGRVSHCKPPSTSWSIQNDNFRHALLNWGVVCCSHESDT